MDAKYEIAAAKERVMFKDLLVNVAIGVEDDATLDYAFALARALDAHAAGVAFAYEAVPPAMLIGDGPPTWIEGFRKEAEEAAEAAIGRFKEARRSVQGWPLKPA
jgi:hypothetical protein